MSLLSVHATYQCKECNEIFDNKVAAIVHHFETEHEDYEMAGCDIPMNVKIAD